AWNPKSRLRMELGGDGAHAVSPKRRHPSKPAFRMPNYMPGARGQRSTFASDQIGGGNRMNEQELVEAARKFEVIRTAVLEEATRPLKPDTEQHQATKSLFSDALASVCGRAIYDPDLPDDILWWHFWTKVRYSGIAASIATAELDVLEPFLGDFRTLGSPDW